MMKKIWKILIVIVLVVISLKTTIDGFPKKAKEDEIREYLTKERILETLSRPGKSSDIYMTIKADTIIIKKEDWKNIEIQINYLNKTRYSLYGDCFNYNITIYAKNISINNTKTNAIITADVKTAYSGGVREAYLIEPRYDNNEGK